MNRLLPWAVMLALVGAAVVFVLLSGDEDGGAGDIELVTEDTLVYLLGNDLWVAPLDGSASPQAITFGSFAAQYAGFVRTTAGDIALYYVEHLAESDPTGLATEAALYRVKLGSGARDELYRFEVRNLSPYHSAAAVSSDGAHVLIADSQGIILLDATTGTTRRLLTNSPLDCGPQTCRGYSSPRWSPTGQRALIAKTFWEGGQDIVIDPFAQPVEELRTPGGAAIRARWSPDGERICVSELTYSSAGAVLAYDLSTGDTVDITLNLELPRATPLPGLEPADPGAPGGRIDSRACVWSDEGDLTIAYKIPDNFRDSWIAVLDSSFQVLQQSDPIPDLSRLVEWLPDGSGVLFNRWQPQEGRPLPPGIFDSERGLLELPFEADAILALIP